ncbi:MAG: hypothetical protein HQ517_00075 [SAR324 cluster bacterium]|nr:hypothetical protein [SAR324 cluster bacterium]
MEENTFSDINELFAATSAKFAEAVFLPELPEGEYKNIYGRQVGFTSSGGLRELLGAALTGLRSTALIATDELENDLSVLDDFGKLHVPLSLVVYGNPDAYLPRLIEFGCICFKAHDAQNLVDLHFFGQVVSEISLIPVVVAIHGDISSQKCILPNDHAISNWVGNPDGKVEAPTAAQAMVMGAFRRRMPAWNHIDQPVHLASKSLNRFDYLNVAARTFFDHNHLNDMISREADSFNQQFSKNLRPYDYFGSDTPKTLLLSTAAHTAADTRSDLNKLLRKKSAGLCLLNQLWPLPALSINHRKTVRTVFLQAISHSVNQGLYADRFLLYLKPKGQSMVGLYNEVPGADGFIKTIDFAEKSVGTSMFWLDMPLFSRSENLPKFDVLAQRTVDLAPEISKVSLESQNLGEITSQPSPADFNVSPLVRKIQNKGLPYSRLNQFIDGSLTPQFLQGLPLADPFKAYKANPGSTALLKQIPKEPATFPLFSPAKCKDVSAALNVCPHFALPSALLSIQSIADHGMERARKSGIAISSLVPHFKKWINSSNKLAANPKVKVRTLADILRPALDDLLETIKDEQKSSEIRTDAAAIINEIGSVPVAVTRQFTDRHKRQAGSGLLFTTAVNPSLCTGCGLCARNAESGFYMTDNILDSEQSRLTYHRFLQLPETTADTVESLIDNDDVDALSALSSNSSLYHTFPGCGNEIPSGTEYLVHHFMTIRAYLNVPGKEKLKTAIDELIAELNNRLKKVVTDTLPLHQPDKLLGAFYEKLDEQIGPDELFNNWSETASLQKIEKKKLFRKLDLVKELTNFKDLIASGTTGAGRPSCSVVLDSKIKHLTEPPFNPFGVPVIEADGDMISEVANGLCTGYLRHFLDQVRLLRRASLEAKDQYSETKHNSELIGLTWKQLTSDEKAMCNPIVVFATRDWMNGSGQAISSLLANDYPVKIVVIDNGTIGRENTWAEISQNAQSLWPIVASNKSFVGRLGISENRAMFNVIREGLTFDGPALWYFLAPEAADYEMDHQLLFNSGKLAETTRAILPFVFKPMPLDRTHSLAGLIKTPLTHDTPDYLTLPVEFTVNEESVTLNYTFTFADWAFLHRNQRSRFNKTEFTENHCFVSEYIQLSNSERAKKTPVILRIGSDDAPNYYEVDHDIVRSCEITLNNVRVFREWAGLFTVYPDKLKALLNDELKEEYERERKAFESKLNDEKAAWEVNYLENLKAQMKETLLNLSGA